MQPLQEWLSHPRGLSSRLRDLRRGAGLTGRQLAQRLDWQQSKVSRIESGQQLASAEDVRAWAAAVGLAGDQVEELLAEQAVARARAVSARVLKRAGQGPVQAGIVELAASATRIREVALSVMPGLLQIPEYARAVLATVQAAQRGAREDEQRAAADLDAALEARMLRQHALYDPGKTFDFLLAESALRWLVCEPGVMRAQLDRLTAAVGLPRVRLGIVPLGVRLRWLPVSSASLYEGGVTDVAEIETLGGLVLYRGQDVADVSEAIDRLWDDAVTGDAARALIAGAIRALPPT